MHKQLPVLNSLRGIAALGILFHHITVYFLPELAKYSSQFTPFCEKNYLWVDFFFILSGFVACHAHQNTFSSTVPRKEFIHFISSRFTRMYPLHFVVLGCLVLLELVYLFLYHYQLFPVPRESLPLPPFDSGYSEKALLLNVFFLQALPQWGSWNSPAWAISAIWIIAFTIPFSLQYLNHSRKSTNGILFLLCLFSLIFLYDQKDTLDLMSWSGLIRCFSETTMGILTYKLYEHARPHHFLTTSSSCLIFLFLVFLSFALPISHLVTVVLCIPLIINAANLDTPDIIFTNPILLFLGKISFSLYMIHWFVFQFIDKISLVTTGVALHRHCSFPQLTGLTFLILFLMPPLSYIAYKYIEIPLHNRLSSFLDFGK